MKISNELNLALQLAELDAKKNSLLKEVDVLVKLQKKLYSKMDIASPMSSEEKDLNNKINGYFSQINSIIGEKRVLKSNA